MAGLYKKYADQGFHIVGLECQGSAKSDITSLAQSRGVTYQLTTGGDLRGTNVRGIPHGFLFGPDGQLAADDPRGGELEQKIKELLKESLAMMAGPGPYKRLAPLAAQVRSGRGLGAVLKTLRSKKNSKNAGEAKEARMMFAALHGAARGQLDSALAKKGNAPVEALKKLDRIASRFAGDEIATRARKEAAALRRDPKTRKEIAAAGIWAKIEAINASLKPVYGRKNPRSAAFRKRNLAAIRQMIGGCQMLVKQYPGTGAAQKAKTLMDQYR